MDSTGWEDADGQQRGWILENEIAPHVLEEQYGLEVLCVDVRCGAGANGIDGIAWDPEKEQLVVFEAKWTTNSKGASNTKLEGPREGTSDSDIQMTRGWIEDSWETGVQQDNIDLDQSSSSVEQIKRKADADSVEGAINRLIEADSYDRAYFWSSDSRNGKTISRNPSRSHYVDDIFDRVYHLKTGGLTNDD